MKKFKIKANYFYKIIWIDASGLQESNKEWHTIEELKEKAKQAYDDPNVSCGCVIEINKSYIIIAGSKAGDCYSDVTYIPTVNIIKAIKI